MIGDDRNDRQSYCLRRLKESAPLHSLVGKVSGLERSGIENNTQKGCSWFLWMQVSAIESCSLGQS